MRPEIIEDLKLAEASAWLARLQGAQRTAEAEDAFRAWLAESSAHARAFARVTDTWELIPGAQQLAERPQRRPARRRPLRLVLAAAAVLLVVLGVGSAWWLLRPPVYQTVAGEQKTVVLEDGTRMILNTDTRVVVDYHKGQRDVRLDHGEALFEVAHNAERPFVVHVGERQVRALGTVFDVRGDSDHLTVALFKGSVRISHSGNAPPEAPLARAVVLAPGERLTLHPGAKAVVDHPDMAQIDAWRRGLVMFDNASLAQAIAELNRYGGTPVRIADPTLADLRVSGVFSTGDPAEFASAVARLHGLEVARTKQAVVIRR